MLNDFEQRIADLVATKLRDGIVHPGDPDNNIPATPIMLPFRPTSGMPKEMGDLLDKTTILLAEAIVSTIITDADAALTPRAEVGMLRTAAGEKGASPTLIPVHCRCDRTLSNPMMILRMSDPQRVVVDGPSILKGLRAREIDCPHEAIG